MDQDGNGKFRLEKVNMSTGSPNLIEIELSYTFPRNDFSNQAIENNKSTVKAMRLIIFIVSSSLCVYVVLT